MNSPFAIVIPDSGLPRKRLRAIHGPGARKVTMTTMKRTSTILLVLISCGSFAAEPAAPDLADGFRNPGNAARPRAYWNWLNGDVSLPDLIRDLEEAKAKGLGGLDMWDTEAMRNPGGFVPAGPPFMGPESVAALHHSIKEAKRLGMDLGLIN